MHVDAVNELTVSNALVVTSVDRLLAARESLGIASLQARDALEPVDHVLSLAVELI